MIDTYARKPARFGSIQSNPIQSNPIQSSPVQPSPAQSQPSPAQSSTVQYSPTNSLQFSLAPLLHTKSIEICTVCTVVMLSCRVVSCPAPPRPRLCPCPCPCPAVPAPAPPEYTYYDVYYVLNVCMDGWTIGGSPLLFSSPQTLTPRSLAQTRPAASREVRPTSGHSLARSAHVCIYVEYCYSTYAPTWSN